MFIIYDTLRTHQKRAKIRNQVRWLLNEILVLLFLALLLTPRWSKCQNLTFKSSLPTITAFEHSERV